MALQMKEKSEQYGQPPSGAGEAYGSTFCRECVERGRYVCPNCQGELLRRPSRKATAAS
jgi:hypothetical protein